LTIIVGGVFGHYLHYRSASVAVLPVAPFEAVSFEGRDLLDSHRLLLDFDVLIPVPPFNLCRGSIETG
jgi:hypothetical protein